MNLDTVSDNVGTTDPPAPAFECGFYELTDNKKISAHSFACKIPGLEMHIRRLKSYCVWHCSKTAI